MPFASSSSFSCTALHLSKEDEEREIDTLTITEKEEIINDMYGPPRIRQNNTRLEEYDKNNDDIENAMEDGVNNSIAEDNTSLPVIGGFGSSSNNNNNNGYDDDETIAVDYDDSMITEELLDRVDDEIELIPEEDKVDYLNALVLMDENVFEREYNPKDFLRCEDYDPCRAARRIIKYWKNRCDVFGVDHAYQPLTLNGAMKNVIKDMASLPNICRILPNDDHGRTVVCWDRTGVSYKYYNYKTLVKIAFYVLHKVVYKQRTVQERGIIFIGINQSSAWDFPSLNFTKMVHETIAHCLPLKICCIHGCVSSLVATYCMPIVKIFLPSNVRLRFQLHDTIKKPSLLNNLERFGLRRNALPKSIGGAYDEKSTWIYECENLLKNNRKRQRDDDDDTTAM